MLLWIKAFHVFFVIAWFAGLFYLPRLFVYHCEVADEAGHQRFCLMEKRLYGITTIGMVGTWVLGVTLVLLAPAYLKAHWLHAKLALVIALSAYHGWLKTRMRAFAAKANARSARYYRVANEVPALALLAILILVIVKPF